MIEALHEMTFVGICEEFAVSLSAMSMVMRWRAPTSRVIQLNQAPGGQPVYDVLSPDEIDALRRRTVVDQAVYDAARSILAEACCALDIVAPGAEG